ncbi:MAG: helix-turn-helix domain-containing protein [Planctomycetes bacterium]|nr:helix-turn-helix domain-containing protein [Planctomycetota bacterium]
MNTKKRYEKYGLEGLKNLSSVSHSHPRATKPKVIKKILTMASRHPLWGCVRISKKLKAKGTRVSFNTIRKILKKNGSRAASNNGTKPSNKQKPT